MNMKQIIITILLALLIIPMGVEAKKKGKKDEVPQLISYPSAELDEYRLHGGEVVIRGRIVANDPQVIKGMEGRISVIVRDYIVRKEEMNLFDIKADGTFSMNLHVPYPMFVLVYPMTQVYAMPGDTIDVTMDTTKPSREEGVSVSGTGVSGEVSRVWLQTMNRYCQFSSERRDEESPEEVMKWKDQAVERLDSIVRQMNEGLPELAGCSPLAADVLKTSILTMHMINICEKFQFMDKEDIDQEQYWQEYFSFVAPREKYLLDNPLLLIAGDEFFFNRLEYSIMEPVEQSSIKSRTLPIDYTTSNDIEIYVQPTLREARREAMAKLHDKLQLSPTNFAAQICMLRDLFTKLEWPYYGQDIDSHYDFEAEDVASTLPYITNADLMRRAVLTYREYVKKYELKAAGKDDTALRHIEPMTKGDSIFQSIIEPYKGNVLYVDFWEMSCGPCRAKMLQMRDEVDANKDKPVKYLYITDDTPEQCRAFLVGNDIKGEHIHVTRSQWGYLQEKFQFTGIPFVVIFDKDGNRREDKTVEQLLEKLK